MTKYQNLKSDLRATWLLKEIEIIPLVIGATGLVKKNFKNYLESFQAVQMPMKYRMQL